MDSKIRMARLYSDDDLNSIYQFFVKKPESYFTKRERLPPCTIKAWNNSYKGHDFPRVWAYYDLEEWIQKHKLVSCGVLASCGGDPELDLFKPSQIVEIPYPPYDLHQIGTQFQDKFDFFLFNQTIEHLHNPQEAIRQINLTLKSGGYVFTSVPTLNIPHSTPIHFGGFNPMGLAMLFLSNGFRIVEMGQWGNYDYIKKLWLTHTWPDADALLKNGTISNEEANVCQCWILAQKL
jgi:SAM-dependent methyltransferase